MKVFVVRADFGKYTEAFLANEYVGIGWFESKEHPINELNNRFIDFFNECLSKFRGQVIILLCVKNNNTLSGIDCAGIGIPSETDPDIDILSNFLQTRGSRLIATRHPGTISEMDCNLTSPNKFLTSSN